MIDPNLINSRQKSSENLNNQKLVEILSQYFQQRGSFLAQVIRADLTTSNYLSRLNQSSENSYDSLVKTTESPISSYTSNGNGHSNGNGKIQSSSVKIKTEIPQLQKKSVLDIENTLIDLIVQQTGYPQNSISGELRLLDDLNLDSIKAGELVASAAQKLGVAGKLEPSSLANATIKEVADTLNSLADNREETSVVENDSQAFKLDIPQLLLNLVEAQTGFPQDTLSLELRLLDDLNLDSIKAGELVASAAQKLGVAGKLEPSSLANATLADVAEVLATALASKKTDSYPTVKFELTQPETAKSWVRNFKIQYICREKTFQEEANWSTAQVLIISDNFNNFLVKTLKEELLRQKAQVETITYQQLSEQTQLLSGHSHYLAFLPQTPTDIGSFPLEAMTTRLKSIATAPKNASIAYIQFGGGRFGTENSNIHPEVCSAAAFARSVHLERNDLRVRVIDLSSEITPKTATELILQEIAGSEAIATVGYDADLTRWLPQAQLQQPIDYVPRSHSWSDDDVILVTGGGKGITAECALALAESTKVSMALVGRSSEHSEQITQTLKRFADQGLTCKYYSCDLADGKAVKELVEVVTSELGAITGIVHGAGLNTPRRVEQVSLEAAQQEVSPKLLGAFNLLQALEAKPLKIFVAFSSIIGVTGMAGNSWYGFANESLALLLNRFSQEHPETDVISLAYSVWSEVGMGARMGSIKNLARMGIGAIPPQEGIERFLGLFKGNPGVNQVVIAARLGGLDTWHPSEITLDKQLRFIEEVEYVEPGVETRVKAHLTLERDRYVGDHIWRGSYLFPTVFGLEAMAQATAYVLGESQPEIARIEHISLRRPVVVNPDRGTQIQIRAEVLEKDREGEVKVRVGIGTEQTNFSSDHFSAVLVVAKRTNSEQSAVKIGEKLDIQPKLDLYNGLLFQGELFQRLEKIYSLSRDLSILSTTTRPSAELTTEGFPEGLGGHLVLGDAYFRDVLLQCMQVNIPQDICLPVQIDRIQFHHDPSLESGERILQAILHKLEGREYLCEVIATDLTGEIRERITGYRLRILEEHPENPSADQLAHPEQRDRSLLKKTVTQACQQLSLIPSSLELGYLPGLGAQEQKQRRQQERPLIASALAHYLDLSPAKISFKLKTLPSGKPLLTVKDFPEISLSLSHDERYCLSTVGAEPQGCDLEVITHRSPSDWLALLGAKHNSVVTELVSRGDELDKAGTRIWSATEAIRKAFNGTNPEFTVAKLQGTSALLQAKSEAGTHLVLTISLQLTRSPERIIALVVQPQKVALHPLGMVEINGEKNLCSSSQIIPQLGNPQKVNLASATVEQMVDTIIQPHHHRVEITNDGPQGQRVYLQRFQVSFRQACSISRNVPVSQYISWVGKFREIPMISMAKPMLRDFYSGQYGMVTNDVSLRILGDVTTYDTIQGRCWLGNLKDSSFDTYIEFCKVLPDHSLERVAMAEVKATWVKLLKYGVPAPEPLPDYLANFLNLFTVNQPATIDLKNAPTVTLPQLPEALASLEPGELLYQATPSPKRDDLLFSNSYQTTLEEANAVGNVYYGNYFIWQGRTLDLFFYQFIPEYFRVEQAKGEVLPVYSRMTFLKEAMPFDTIRANLYVDRVTKCGAVFYFQFFREMAGNNLEKLHQGEQEVIWATRDSQGKAIASPWPEEVLQALLKYAQQPLLSN